MYVLAEWLPSYKKRTQFHEVSSKTGWTFSSSITNMTLSTHQNETLMIKFNVFHVRALYYTKNIKHQRMHKGFFSSLVIHSYIFRPCWVILRENFLPWLHYGCTLQLSCWLCTNKCTKVFSSLVIHSHMFRPCWVIFRENFQHNQQLNYKVQP
jgi:hypothetical protein